MAEKEKLEKLLCEKISRELAGFKQETLLKEKEEIYGMAYEIDSMINLYELLGRETENYQEEVLETLTCSSEFVGFFVMRSGWSYEDYRRQDFVEYLAQEIRKMQETRRKGQEVEDSMKNN